MASAEDTTQHPTAGDVVVRPNRGTYLMAAFWVLLGLGWWSLNRGHWWSWGWILLSVMWGATLIALRWRSVRVGADGITIQGLLRTRRWAWTDLEAVSRPRRLSGGMTSSVTLWPRGHRRVGVALWHSERFDADRRGVIDLIVERALAAGATEGQPPVGRVPQRPADTADGSDRP